MPLSPQEILKIAYLARIEIDPGATETYLEDLTRILTMVETVRAVDTDGVEPMASPLEEPLPMRPDAVTEVDQRETLQAGAPLTEDGLYLVPRVIE